MTWSVLNHIAGGLIARNDDAPRLRALSVGRAWGVFCLVVMLGVAAHTLHAGQKDYHLAEQLGQTWDRQLVTFPFEAKPGECHVDSLSLTEGNKPAAFQMIEVETWPGGPSMIRSAKLAIVVDFKPCESRRWVLHFGNAAAQQKLPATDLQIQQEADAAHLTTSRFGIRVPLGEQTYEPPVAAEKVPAPVTAMRLAEGGLPSRVDTEVWFGGSQLYGSTKLRRFSARLTEAGPILGEVTYRYEYADGNVLTLRAQLSAGDYAVYWEMGVQDDQPDCGWRLVVNRELPPLVFPMQGEARTSRKVARWEWLPVRLDEHAPGLITNVVAWGDWFSDYTQTAVRLQIEGTGSELRLVSHDSGAWVNPAPMGVWMSSGGRKDKAIPLRKSAQGDVFFELNLASGEARLAKNQERVPIGGERRFYLGHFPAVSPVPAPSEGLTKNREVWERYAQVQFSSRRLDHVKDLVLDWPRRAERRRPSMFVTADDLVRARKRESIPQEVLAAALRLRGRPMDRNPAREVPQVLAAWWLTGERKMAQELQLADRLRFHLGQLGDFDLMRSAAIVAMLYDSLIDTDLISDAERPLLRAQMAYLAYRAADPSTWSMERGYTSGNPNMSVSYVLGLGTVACALPDHPQAQQWSAPAVHRMNTWLADDLGPKGEWMEGSEWH